jgi:hypothetical protein
MQVIDHAIRCSDCKYELQSPVILPCGESICEKHCKLESKHYTCVHCKVTHPIPDNGFPMNKALEKILSTKIENIQLPTEYEEAFQAYTSLAKSIADFHLLKKDPCCLISADIGELKSEIDLLREQFKFNIDEHAKKVIEELDEFEKECQQNVKSRETNESKDADLEETSSKSRKRHHSITSDDDYDYDDVEAIEEVLSEIKKKMSQFKKNKVELIKLKLKCQGFVDFEDKFMSERKQLFLGKLLDYKFKVSKFNHKFNPNSG